MLADILYDAALRYKLLLDKEYQIVLGRKQNVHNLRLLFPMDSFFHLAGLQHLTDITYSSTNKERIYKEILAGKLTNENLQKSAFYEKYFLRERVLYLPRLEEMLDSSQLRFLINQKEYIKYTKIQANFLFQYKLPEKPECCLNFFSVKEYPNQANNIYKGCSFFKKHEIDYTRGTSETKLLLNKKVIKNNMGDICEEELFRHKKYPEGQHFGGSFLFF